jgi:hypothetical protein
LIDLVVRRYRPQQTRKVSGAYLHTIKRLETDLGRSRMDKPF